MFRNGDFYELFEDDAELGSRILGITLTKRDGHTPMAGFPVHKLEHYLNVLLKGGHRVAVCEQMEEASQRQEDHSPRGQPRRHAGHRHRGRAARPAAAQSPRGGRARQAGRTGLAWVDLSTGCFFAVDLPDKSLPDELARLGVVECLLADDAVPALTALLGPNPPRSLVSRPAWNFEPATANAALRTHFAVATLSGFGFDDAQPALVAAGGLLVYLQETLKANLGHIRRLQPYRPEQTLILDEVTRRSLELTRTLRDGHREGSLIGVLDRTVTPMGARFLHDALLAPLNDKPGIEARLDAVEELLHNHPLARPTARPARKPRRTCSG